MTKKRLVKVAVTVAGLAVLLAAGLALVLRWIGPPDGSAFMPLPTGVEVVDERAWCAAGDGPIEWKYEFRSDECVHETRVRAVGVDPDILEAELAGRYGRSLASVGGGDQMIVTRSPSDSGLVSLMYVEKW